MRHNASRAPTTLLHWLANRAKNLGMNTESRLDAIATAVANHDLPDASRALYIALVTTHGINTQQSVTVDDLGALIGASRPTAHKAVTGLVAAGYVTRTRRPRRPALLTIHSALQNEMSRAS